MTKTALDDLWDELDRAALALLKEAMGGGGTLPGAEGEATLASGGSLNEKTRVFSAISAYAKSRQESGPQKPSSGKSGFDELRDQFRGVGPGGERGATKRRARAGEKASTAISYTGPIHDSGSGGNGGGVLQA